MRSVCIISVLRLIFLNHLIRLSDPSKGNVDVIYWSTVELNLAIVIACVPTFRPLVAKFYPRMVPTSQDDTGAHPPTISSPPHRLRSVETIAL